MSNKKEYRKEYYQRNKEKEKERANQWNKNNLEKCKENTKRYYEINCEKLKEYSRQWHRNNIKEAKEYQKQNQVYRNEWQKQWRKVNPEKLKQYQKNSIEYKKQWNKDNPEYQKERLRNKRKTDLKYNLNKKVSGGIYKSLKGSKNGRRWEIIVGYTLNNLVKRLKKTMPEGYTWNNYINGRLQIDHIIPISVFNFTKPEHTDFKRCWALKNLRLLPAKENQEKSNKLEKPFQPSLMLIN